MDTKYIETNVICIFLFHANLPEIIEARISNSKNESTHCVVSECKRQYTTIRANRDLACRYRLMTYIVLLFDKFASP